MSATPPTTLDRLLELLAEQAMQPLSDTDRAELERLIVLHPDIDAACMDLIAAELCAQASPPDAPQMPDSLRQRIERDYQFAASLAGSSGERPAPRATPPVGRRSSPVLMTLGWLAAAACLGLAVAGWWPRLVTGSSQVAPARSLAVARQHFLGSTPDAKVSDWQALADPAARGVTGDVVWSDSTNQGYVRVKGLSPNDPARTQYQFWIFDEALENPEQPISAAVFNIDAASVDPATGDALIPISPSLPVTKAKAFAVTIEKPGGVVVSKREHLLLLAPVK